MIPADFQALSQVWRDQREYESIRHADIMAALNNIPLQVGFSPPGGAKAWLREMLLSGWKPESKPDVADWKKTKEAFGMMAEIARYRNRPLAEKREHRAKLKAALAANRERRARAAQMKAAGEPVEKIRLMMKGIPYA